MDSLNEAQVENQIVKMKSINNGGSNIITRVSIQFKKKVDQVNKKRNDLNFNELSFPKITELIIRHKLWNKIEEDIVKFSMEDI